MHDSSSPSAEFSDPCFIRCFIRGSKSVDPYPNDSRGGVTFQRLVLLLSCRWKVALHDASTSGFGANKPRNEANGNEAQADGRQGGKTRSIDSGGEKQTQFVKRLLLRLVAKPLSSRQSRWPFNP